MQAANPCGRAVKQLRSLHGVRNKGWRGLNQARNEVISGNGFRESTAKAGVWRIAREIQAANLHASLPVYPASGDCLGQQHAAIEAVLEGRSIRVGENEVAAKGGVGAQGDPGGEVGGGVDAVAPPGQSVELEMELAAGQTRLAEGRRGVGYWLDDKIDHLVVGAADGGGLV